MPEPHEYLHIKAWGRYMGSNEGFIEHQQLTASRDAAPVNAIYERDGEWVTYDEVKNEVTRAAIELLLKQFGGVPEVVAKAQRGLQTTIDRLQASSNDIDVIFNSARMVRLAAQQLERACRLAMEQDYQRTVRSGTTAD